MLKKDSGIVAIRRHHVHCFLANLLDVSVLRLDIYVAIDCVGVFAVAVVVVVARVVKVSWHLLEVLLMCLPREKDVLSASPTDLKTEHIRTKINQSW